MPPLDADTMTLREARDRLAEVVRRAEHDKERTVILKDGRPVAVVVPVEDAASLERLEDEQDIADARAALEEWRRSGEPAVPLDEALKEFGIER